MTCKKIFLYPLTKEMRRAGSNSYMTNLRSHLNREFRVINDITEVGLLDSIRNFYKTDVFYFNWIEDLPTRKFGLLQVLILPFLLLMCKLTNKKIIWFIHNNISHNNQKLFLKRFIIRLMAKFADLIFSHSGEIALDVPRHKLQIFHHPMEFYRPLPTFGQPTYDLLIWGSVAPYKGISSFVQYVSTNNVLKEQKILIAGRFESQEYFDFVMQNKPANISVKNKILSEDELVELFSKTKYILFTYSSRSVLSSAALCKSLAFAKEVIAPNIGSFKELGEKGLLYTYDNFDELPVILASLAHNETNRIDQAALSNYVVRTDWNSFSAFLAEHIYGKLYPTKTGEVKRCSSI